MRPGSGSCWSPGRVRRPRRLPGSRCSTSNQVASAEPGSIADRSGTDLAALLYTGGTTSRSKGVPLTHAGLYWCGSAAHEQSVRSNVTSSVLPLPLAHAYGLLVFCGGMHRTDHAKTILMRWFDPAGWVKLAGEHKVQGGALVPSMIQMLLSQPLEDTDLSNLVAISSGAAPLAEEVRREFETRVPTATVYEGYGCTEAATFISANPWGARRLGSVGLPVPGVELTIQDEAGQALPAGQDGEICVRSPGVMTGYWHSEDTSALAGGWLHTGDIGHVDDDGYLYVVDRKKDLILRGGFNVFPRDIEDVLLSHPAVAQAGVVGRPDARLGEEVVAFVSLRPGAEATAGELTEHAKRHLAANKYPREITIVPMVPLTSVGKLDRKKLREWVRGEPPADLCWLGWAGWIWAGWMWPVTSPKPILVPSAAGAVALIVTSSPSSRKLRTDPSASVSGSAPPQLSSSRQPRWSRSGPLTVPEPNRSPVRADAPFTVMWASICAAVQ